MGDVVTALAEDVGLRLHALRAVLVTAESCTGGGIAEAITRIPGSSRWFDRAWVTYSNDAKIEELGVDALVISRHGAVSEPVVMLMAEQARQRAGADWAVAVSGVAGPDGGSVEKPVGTVWVAWAGPQGTQTQLYHFSGDRAAVRLQTIEQALSTLKNLLLASSAAV